MKEITALLDHFRLNKNEISILNKWRRWAYQVLKRRNFPLDLSICAYGKHHLVDRVKPFGGGYIFWSKACNGCQLGKALINLKQNHGLDPAYAHCTFLESGLLTRDQVKPGDVYALPSILD